MDESAANEKTVRAFCDAFGTGDVEQLLAFFTPDAVYHNMPMDPAVGHDAIRAILGMFVGEAGSVTFDILATATSGDLVFTERVDHITMGDRKVSLPVAGVFQQRTGNLVRPIPLAIILPMFVGLALCVVGVCISGTEHPQPTALVPTAAVAAALMAVAAKRTNKTAFVWAMLVFFFWFMAIWIFITVFADIFRRRDLSGGAKAGWIILIFIVPFLGAIIYLIARPKMTAQDKEDMERMQEAERRVSGYSPADEVAKLSKLRDDGKITAEEYEDMKKRAMMQL